MGGRLSGAGRTGVLGAWSAEDGVEIVTLHQFKIKNDNGLFMQPLLISRNNERFLQTLPESHCLMILLSICRSPK